MSVITQAVLNQDKQARINAAKDSIYVHTVACSVATGAILSTLNCMGVFFAPAIEAPAILIQMGLWSLLLPLLLLLAFAYTAGKLCNAFSSLYREGTKLVVAPAIGTVIALPVLSLGIEALRTLLTYTMFY